MTLGSLFDGSGTAPLCASILGWKPLWAIEVEPYPVAVTHSHFRDMTHYGDIADISGFEIEPVDVIVFGSPCQYLSVAGKRDGLENGKRSSLFYEAIRIIKEMREATHGVYPRYAVWENVPEIEDAFLYGTEGRHPRLPLCPYCGEETTNFMTNDGAEL